MSFPIPHTHLLTLSISLIYLALTLSFPKCLMVCYFDDIGFQPFVPL